MLFQDLQFRVLLFRFVIIAFLGGILSQETVQSRRFFRRDHSLDHEIRWENIDFEERDEEEGKALRYLGRGRGREEGQPLLQRLFPKVAVAGLGIALGVG